jgi:hypothetical protein
MGPVPLAKIAPSTTIARPIKAKEMRCGALRRIPFSDGYERIGDSCNVMWREGYCLTRA